MNIERPSNDDRTLFDRTSRLAGETAARMSGQRRQQILALIDTHGPLAIFEIAAYLGVSDHQISGRFGEMVHDRILYVTGERRIKPETQQQCDVYARRPTAADQHVPEILGYPPTIVIGEEGVFDRSPVLGDGDLPGVPYSSRGPIRQSWRVEVIECPGCGRPLKFFAEKIAGKDVKKFRCSLPGCNRTWQLMLVSEPGRAGVLALVMTTL
jgi:hypothetical protein